MSNSKIVRIPKRGVNPEILRRQLNQKERAIGHHQESIGKLAQMVQQNCRIIGQVIGMIEVLKDKGLITNDEINAKLKELDEKNQKAAKEALEAERKILVENQEKKYDAKDGESLGDEGAESDGEKGGSDPATPEADISVESPEANINNDSENPSGSTVQSEAPRNVEDHKPNGGLKLL